MKWLGAVSLDGPIYIIVTGKPAAKKAPETPAAAFLPWSRVILHRLPFLNPVNE
jgi:hypothetical protein